MANSLIVASVATGQNFTDAATYFTSLSGLIRAGASEAQAETPVRDGGTFSNLYVYVSANTASVTSVITLRKSQADTAVTVSYTSDQTGVKEDTSNSVLFANTDEVDYSIVVPSEAGTNNMNIRIMSVQFAPTTTTDCIMFFMTNGAKTVNSASTSYYLVPNGQINHSITEADSKYRIRQSFTSSDFYAYASANARTTDTVFSTRKSGGDGGQGFTYTSGQTGVKEDNSGTDSLAAGDDFCFEIVTSTGTETMTLNVISCSMISTANFFPLLTGDAAGSGIVFNSTDQFPSAGALLFTTTELRAQTLPRFDFTATEFGTYATANTIITTATPIHVRDNGANGNLTVSYDVLQTGLKNDSVNSDVFTSGSDEINYQIITPNTAGTITLTWLGVLGSTAVTPATAKISKMMLMGVG